MKTNWLDRHVLPAPFFCLCLSENEYKKAFKALGVEPKGAWINPGAQATVSTLINKSRGLCSIVCLDAVAAKEHSSIDVYEILIHESVHIWQEWCEHYGERTPGMEQAAYFISRVSSRLMAEYDRRTKQS